MKNLPLLALASFITIQTPVFGQSVPIDLNTWTQESFSQSGNWTVSTDGTSVFQSINGAPTFFVSPNDIINTSFNGRFTVETTSDDDFIGFVFGYQSPISTNGDSDNDFNFFLFDWKQAPQNVDGRTAEEGFTLSLVNGIPENNSGNPATSSELQIGELPWWNHSDSSQQFVNTDFGLSRGWMDNVEYEFDLVYQTNRIKIDIQGGSGDFATKQTIFELTPSDFGLSSFQTGRFGFYNYSQESVRYQGFTQAPEPPTSTPEPTAVFSLLMLSAGSLFKKINQKKH